MSRWPVLMALGLLAGAGNGLAEGSGESQRQKLLQARTQVEAGYAQARRECAQRFVVTACEDQAKSDRRAALDQIQRQVAALDESRRRQRASEKLKLLALRHQDGTQAIAAAAEPRAPSTLRQRVREPEGAASKSRVVPRPASAAARAEAQARAAALRRQQEVDAHRTQVEQRNAEQSASKPPAAGLPEPAASRATLR